MMKGFFKYRCQVFCLVVFLGYWECIYMVQPSHMMQKEILLMEETSGEILYEKNAYRRLYPASTTKILTALVSMENADLEEMVTVGYEVTLIPSDSSKAGIKEGEVLSLKALIKAIILASGNDAANTIAVYIGRRAAGDEGMEITQAMDVFNRMMNDRATMAGAMNSNFVNPHGYHDDNHYSTAYDLAMISRAAMQYPFFREVALSPSSYTNVLAATDGAEKMYTWTNRNAFVQPLDNAFYPDATGVKTGYTGKAGYCFVSSASRGHESLIAVVLNSSEKGRWHTSQRLLDYGFSAEQDIGWRTFLKAVLSFSS